MSRTIFKNIELIKSNNRLGKRIIEDVTLYPYSSKLYEALHIEGLFDRLKLINQLGNIKVKKKQKYSRYDYVMLQIHLHSIAQDFNQELEYSYCNSITSLYDASFKPVYENDIKKDPSIAELVQCLCIIYNCGHFFNTFTSSRALLEILREDDTKMNQFLGYFTTDKRISHVKRIIDSNDYHNTHLINCLLLLESLKNQNEGVQFTLRILDLYLDYLSHESLELKVNHAFTLFRKVRDLTYIIYDLNVADISLILDFGDKNNLKVLLREMLSTFNNQKDSIALVYSIQKMLSDTIYNEPKNLINQYRISQKIHRNYNDSEINLSKEEYLQTVFLNPNSVFNKKYTYSYNFDNEFLKLTFDDTDNVNVPMLAYDINRMNYFNAGYYNRRNNVKTLIVAIRRDCPTKEVVVLRLLKYLIHKLLRIESVKANDSRYLLITKYFLYYLFKEHRLVINSEVSNESYVITSRGNKQRINYLNELLRSTKTEVVEKLHEVEWIRTNLKNDSKRDISIVVPSSILIFEKNKDKHLCELDGLVIYPHRTTQQILFFEAKSGEKSPTKAKRELDEKFGKIGFPVFTGEKETSVGDICYKLTIMQSIS